MSARLGSKPRFGGSATERCLKSILAVLLLGPLVGLTAAGSKSDAMPNIALILIDDFGYEKVSVNGGESYKPPEMDQLAATGVRFGQCHVQPLSTPTQVELMTGLSNRSNYVNFGYLDPSQMTLGNLLRDAG